MERFLDSELSARVLVREVFVSELDSELSASSRPESVGQR